MLSPGNKKLGGRLIWNFGLPSGQPEVCVGMTELCRQHCYARRMERLRPQILAKYQRNLQLSFLPDFAQRMRYCILNQDIQVVRVHTGGDFYAPAYARQWLKVMRGLPQVRFFFYSRAWRLPSIRPILEMMADLPNCRVWFSGDRECGFPTAVHPNIRLAWLQTAALEMPPVTSHLIFRTRPLRRQPQTRLGGIRICPEEDGIVRQHPVTCDRCRLCWKPLD